MTAGADGYLSKNTTKLEIIEAIDCLKNNKTYYSQEVAEVLAKDNGLIKLSGREQEVLQLLSRGFSSIQIGVHLSLAESTIKTYRKNLLEKFGATNAAQLTRTALEGGYL